jgi:bifunctional ADP-heptose synthase (sugar kinase/adenylyltransferase)
MGNARLEKFRILVVGDVISNSPFGADAGLRLNGAGDVKQEPQFGGAANIARLAAGLGAVVGFLLLGKIDAAAQIHQISHFHMLLPQYDVIIFSEYGNCALDDLNNMVASARKMGKRVLVDLDGPDLGASTGASLMTSDIEALRNMIGAWRSEQELTIKMTKLLAVFNCESFLMNRHDAGVSLYVSDNVIHFVNMARCDKHFLVAAVAATLKAGVSVSAAVAKASDRYDPAIACSPGSTGWQEEVSL